MNRIALHLALAGVLFTSIAPRALAAEANCNITILNRSVQFGPGGSFAIPNLPYQPGYFRVRIACTEDGQSSGGQSAFFSLPLNGSVDIPPITLGPLSALPVAMFVTSPTTNLTTKGATAQLVARAFFADGSSADVTSPAQGTLWSSSRGSVAEVGSNGLVTAVARGTAIIQALNEGVQATFSIHVSISDDVDNDGLPDDYELAFGMNPSDSSDAALDFDADGLTNLQEFQAGTNPRLPDTDDDQLTDGEEVRLATKPVKNDTDSDGLSDGQEIRRGFNPLANDTDHDGILDGLELRLGLNPLLAESTTRVEGRVLDTNGAPVAGANVALFGIMTARTDESGAFSLQYVPASLGPIQASAEVVRAGRVYDATSMVVPSVAGGMTDLRNLSLRLNSGNVVGVVTDPLNALVPGALVTVSNGRDTRTAKTDANGFYRVPNMTAGSLVVTVRDPKTGLRGPAQGTLALNQSAVVNVQLGPFGTVAGTVYARDGVTAVSAGVPVTLGMSGRQNLTTQTDALGKYRFEFVPLGIYTADATDSSGNHGRSSGEILATSQVTVSDISFLGRGAIVGVVLNGGQPVSNAVVTFSGQGVFGGSGSLASDAAGRFGFSNLFAGPFLITAQIPLTRLAGSSTGVVEFDGQFVTNNVVLASSGTITGTVFRADGTSMVANAEVTLLRVTPGAVSQTGLQTTTDSQGKFGFSLVPLGTYRLEAFDAATGDRNRGGGVELTFQNQVVTGNITLLGQGSLTVNVRDGAGAPVRGVQLTLFTFASFFSASVSAVSDSAGVAQFDVVQAGPISLNAKDPNTGLQGTTNGTMAVGTHTDLVLRLQSAGTIAGRVFLPDGATPASGVNLVLSALSSPGFSIPQRQQNTGADGTFRFEHCPLANYQLDAIATGIRRAQATGLLLTNHGQQIERHLTLAGVGTVTGIVRQSDSSPVSDVNVYVTTQDNAGGSLGARTDVNGRYTITNVSLGPFNAVCSFTPRFASQESSYFGSAPGQIQTNGEIVTADIQLNGNLTFFLATLLDGNNASYDLRTDAAVRSGALSVFGFAQLERGAGRLEIIAGTTNSFVGRLPAALSINGRETAIAHTNLAGLDVTRRVYVPREGYFARYLEVLSNRTPSAITVGVRLTSHFRYTFTPALSEPRIITTSSGDALLSVSNPPARDRWVVIDDESDEEPFLTSTLPAVAHVFDGTNGQRQAASASFTLDPTDNLGFGRLVEQWTNITVQPGSNVMILHFLVQQISRAAAQVSAARLSQIPPEALTGLTPSDLRLVQNFALPTNGISSVPPLSGLTGSINGLVLSGDNATTIGGATVNFRSTNILFGRTYSRTADPAGRFGFNNYLNDGNAGVVPLNGFSLSAVHPFLAAASPPVMGTFASGTVVATQNVVFSGMGALTGTVRRHNDVVTSAGSVRITGEPLPGPLTVGIAPNGVYGMSALEPDVYALFAEVPTTQGSPLRGVASAPIVAGQKTIADIIIEQTGTLIGTLRRTNGSAAVNLRVQLSGASDFTRSVFTDTGGRFTFGDVPSGPVSLDAFEPANNASARAEAVVLTDQTVVQDLFLSSDGTVLGSVLASGGQPFAGAQVTLEVGGSVFNGTAGSNGTYRFNAVPTGQVIVSARDAGTGFRGFTNGFLAVAGQTLNLNVYAAAVGSVSGTVFRPDGITPVPGASVSAFGGALSTVADAAGQYALDFVPVGNITVNAMHPPSGEEGFVATLISSNNAVAAADVVLGPVVTISDTTLAEGNVGTRDAIFTLTLSSSSSRSASARFFTSNGTAVAFSDYFPTNGTITFAPGVTNRILRVKVMGDPALEANETFFLSLSNATDLTLVGSRGTGTITNDDKLPGHIDHFEWAPVPGPQLDHVPFVVTVTARDASNHVATNFSGPVGLSATVGGAPLSGTLLGLPPNGGAQFNPFAMEVGNSFIPAVDILVTHVVHYFGNKVSILPNDGSPLLAQAVSSTPGTWVESPLQQPLRLTAGESYRITTFLPAGAYGYRRIGLANPFADGTLGHAVLGTGLSQNPDIFGYWMVDLRYTPITSAPVATSPTTTGIFSNGVWSGEVAILAPATNAVLAADDGDGHKGLANGIDVRYGNDLLVFVQGSPNTVPIGGTLFYTITVTNTGPTVANNVVVTNKLPTGFRLLSANGTMGTCSFTNEIVTCVMPSVARGAIALIGIAVRPEAVVTEFDTSVNEFKERPATNIVGVTRAEPDGHLLNNVAQAVTRVLRPTLTISDTTVRERNGVGQTAAFDVSLSYPTTEDVTFYYKTFDPFGSGGTATPQVDYVVTYGSRNIPPGQTNATILVPILGDSLVEPPETVVLYLSPDRAATLSRTNGVATILDDDGVTDQIDHFAWTTISFPQFVNEPFAVTLTAKNAAGGTVLNFAGQAFLSAVATAPGQTNQMVNSDPHLSTLNMSLTRSLGYSFIPSTNILVTHVRRYFGDHVSIWSDDGLLLARQNVPGASPGWVEAPLSTPLMLSAGVRYRISVHALPGTHYSRRLDFDFFPHGTIETSYFGEGDSFPQDTDGFPRWMVGLKYAVGGQSSVPVSPAHTTAFANGAWTGLVTVSVPASNVVLRADDGEGTVGEANPFTVQLRNDLIVTAAAAPVPADIRSNLIYVITVTNLGPVSATGVTLTNVLPAEVHLISAVVSQGSQVSLGRTITCSFGTLGGAGSATLTITCRPVLDAIILTNVATVGRAEADSFASNNTNSLATPVRGFSAGAVAIVAAEQEAAFQEDVRAKLEALGFFTRVDFLPVYSGLPVPSLSDLEQYGAVIVYPRYEFNDAVALGNVLADYVDAGFGVVAAGDSFVTNDGLKGRLISEHYLPFTQGDYGFDQNLTLVADVPQHPILDGVNLFHGGSGSFHDALLALNPGATLLAHWSNGEPLVGVRTSAAGRMAALNFFPASSDVLFYLWRADTDGARLMANALRWTSPAPILVPNDLALTLIQAPVASLVGGTITYTLVVTNPGPSSANGVVVTNILPQGVAIVSAVASQGTLTTNGGILFGNLGTLPSGAHATLNITAQALMSGSLTNTASIQRTEADPYLRNNRAFSVVTVRAPAVTVTDAVPVTEGNVGTNAVFIVTLSSASPQNVFVPFVVSEGNAQAGSDFVPTNGTLVFIAGETSKVLRVSVVVDGVREGEEIFYLQLLGATNATLLTGFAMGTIVDDDPLPVVAISDASGFEGDTGTTAQTFNISLTPASGDGVIVYCALSNGTALASSDYTGQDFIVFFPPGVTNQAVEVLVIGDHVPEPDETFSVHIYDLEGAVLGRGVATGRILNDDGFAGRLDHFDWAPIPSPQVLNVPFPVTVIARDSFGDVVTSFAGTLPISDGYPTSKTNSFFQNQAHSQVIQNASEGTFGYGFTPQLDLTVTHVRHYFGDKITIWKDDGTVVLCQAVPLTVGNWREEPVFTPVTLRAQTRYRIATHKPALHAVLVGPVLSSLPEVAHSLSPVYTALGDVFPIGNAFGSFPQPLVDLKYILSYTPRFSPLMAGPFTNGVWAGQITAFAPTNNVQLRVDDVLGHSGLANPINILARPDLTVAAGPNPVAPGATLRVFLTIFNQSTAPATGVTITNLLPAGVTLLSVTQSQGNFSIAGSVVTCNIGQLETNNGYLPRSMATVALLMRPNVEGSLTNIAFAGRNEPSLDAGRVVTTVVRVATNAAEAVGYFTDGYEFTTAPAGVISRVGLIPVQIAEITSFDLNSIGILFLNEFQIPPSVALQERLPAVESWVRAGGVLVIHNRYGGNVPYFSSLLSGAVASPDSVSFAGVVPPGDTLVTTGPFGTLIDFDVLGEMSVTLPYDTRVLTTASVPAGARTILNAGGTELTVAFSHALGRGHVYYSAVPLDHFLEQPGARASTNIYAPNVVVYAQSLRSETATNVPGNLELVLGPGTTGWTNGGFQFQINGLSGHGAVIISASSNLLDWEAIFTNPPVNGTIQFFDAGATNKTFRFYRLEER